jgi:hypothetical protein
LVVLGTEYNWLKRLVYCNRKDILPSTDGTLICAGEHNWVGLSRVEQHRDNSFLDRLNGGLFEVYGNKGIKNRRKQ